MNSSDFRTEARSKLTGKWGKAVCIVLAVLAISFAINFVSVLLPKSMQNIFSIVTYIIDVPLTFGLTFSFLKLFNDEDVKAFDFLSLGFSNFGRSWLVSLQTVLKLLVPVILMIVSCFLTAISAVSSIISMKPTLSMAISLFSVVLSIVSVIWIITKSYYYSLANFIAIDNPEMSAKEAVLKSQELMQGKRGKLFILQLSFIGWAILSVLTLGIGYLWLFPYMQFATIAFYKKIEL